MMNVSQPQSTLAGWTPAATSTKSHCEFLHTAPLLSCCDQAERIAGAWGCGEIWARATIVTHPARPDERQGVTPSMPIVVRALKKTSLLCKSHRPSTGKLLRRALLSPGVVPSHTWAAEVKQWRVGSGLTSHNSRTTSSCPLSAAVPETATCVGYARCSSRDADKKAVLVLRAVHQVHGERVTL